MKKAIIIVVICLVILALITNMDSPSTENGENASNEVTKHIEKEFEYDIAFYQKVLAHDMSIFAFDQNSNKVLYFNKGLNTKSIIVSSYSLGTYSGSLEDEFEITIAFGNDQNNLVTRKYKIENENLLLICEDGSTRDHGKKCTIDYLKKMLKETDYFDIH